MEPEEKRQLGHEYFADLKAKRNPMTHILDGTNWFKEISGTLAKGVLTDASEAGMPDDQQAAMKKRMSDWYRILMAYRKDENEVRGDPKMPVEIKRDILFKMSENLNKIRVDIFGE